MKKILAVVAVLFLQSAPSVMAQCDWDYQNSICEADFDYDCDIDANDVVEFLNHFGRSPFNNPCPPNGPAPVEKTGQTTSYTVGDDGDLKKGVVWPNPRFTDNGDNTVTDNLTGLTWLKDANCIGTNHPDFDNDGFVGDGAVNWQNALYFAFELNVSGFDICNAGYHDWRLPNVKELLSLMDFGQNDPALPVGAPFLNVQLDFYWTSTTWAGGSDVAFYVLLPSAESSGLGKTNTFYVWPVRGGR